MVDLPAPERPVSHSTQARCPFWRARTCLSTSSACQCTFCERRSAKLIRPAPTVLVAQPVDEDEAAERAVVGVRLERDRPVELQLAHADVVQLEPLGRQLLQGVDVDLVLQRRDGRRHGARAGSSSGTRVPAASAPRASTRWSPRTGWRPAAVSPAAAMTSPRLTSISDVRVSVTDWPATARGRSPSAVTMRATWLSRPEGSTRMRSPCCTLPLAI